MKNLTFAIPCLFGLEGIVGNECKRLNLANIKVENGRVLFTGDFEDMAKANLWIRSGERILIRLAEFPCKSFSELFDNVKAIRWENFIPKEGAFPVKGYALHSQLHSVPDCQSIVKKAVVERLKDAYHLSWFAETGAKYQIQFGILNDVASIYLDTSGPGLHKRGYRARANDAPLRETLAAGMVDIARYRGREVVYDPFCGSGTILIEAAMIAQNRAPGLYRRFAAESWESSDSNMWASLRSEAKNKIFKRDFRLIGSDIDENALKIAMGNAAKAGVAEYVRFKNCDVLKWQPESESGIVITNPPYGERLLDVQKAEALYRTLGQVMRRNPNFPTYIISSHQELPRLYGRNPTKRRKLYNGMIKCEYYMYY
ncbi:MAG: class I SAM-dependent RNA methyltransferase [Clostridia bacterium]|nr:class I SAM-dependent RNA methyltransferase [Clostridia bacterium]